MSIFGTIKDGTDVETAVLETLVAWMPTYLAELASQRETDAIPSPRAHTYKAYSEFALTTEDTDLPAIIVESSGIDDLPRRQGDGSYIAGWRVSVFAVVLADKQESSMALARSYVAAARAILLQQSSLGGRARGVTWEGESYDEAVADGIELQLASTEFVVEFADVVTDAAGPNAPADPVTQPGSNWPTADDIAATISPEDA